MVTVTVTVTVTGIITNDLKWHKNTKFIVKNANKKMRMHIFKSQGV